MATIRRAAGVSLFGPGLSRRNFQLRMPQGYASRREIRHDEAIVFGVGRLSGAADRGFRVHKSL
jgi:hypothetical protein